MNNPSTACRVILVFLLLLGSATTARGQEEAAASAASSLTPGTLVRVRSTNVGAQIRGVVVAVDGAVLTLAPAGGLPLNIPLQSITRMDVSLGQRRHTLRGLAIGALSGIAVGFVVQVDPQNCDQTPGPVTENFCNRRYAVAGEAGALGLMGAVIGALIKTERWATLSIDLRAAVPTGRRALAAALVLRF